MLTANEIRTRFLEYFRDQGHEVVPSAPLVPREDPSLLFTNAGMVQFKRAFLGQEKRDTPRAASSQKCLRVGGKHNDLENVGRTARHHTFFEMLGNFSFGDYFKAEAIRFAWDFLTRDLGLPAEKLYATVFTDDDEAEKLWLEITGIPKERVYRLGEKDNFWSMGDTGPCGPCSEILFDQGGQMACGPDCEIGVCECDRYLEIWNLVFMQYDQVEAGGERVALPRPSIDTGMGLERIAAVCQGVHSNFDTDLFQALIGHTAKKAGAVYRDNEETDTALRVIADHARAASFMIADAILPSNEGRGYVLRRLIRRAFRFGKLMGLTEPFLWDVCVKVAEVMGQAFPELRENLDFMTRVVREEEERFSQTLDKGLEMLSAEMDRLESENTAAISGAFAFKLYDTYGFPIDIVNDVAEKRGLAVDEDGFNQAMAEQKKRAKSAWKGSGETDVAGLFTGLLEAGVESEFVGYDQLEAVSTVTALTDLKGRPVERLIQGEAGYAVFAVTPFYGESGGQVGDVGAAQSMTGNLTVADAVKPGPELTVHKIHVDEGEILPRQEITLNVDRATRAATQRNHTTTHLLHTALRNVLGSHVKQSGSLVGPNRLRFDFTHIQAMTPEEIRAVEREVNQAIVDDHPVGREYMDYEAAVEAGAMALFGEKYGGEVCVVSVPGVSTELCGGTHLARTGEAGSFLVLSESGLAAGVRRIEAATGLNALHAAQGYRDAAAGIEAMLKARPGEAADKVAALQKEAKALRKENEKLQAKALSGAGRSLMDEARDVDGVKVLTARLEGASVKALREQMDDIRSKMPSGVACLGTAGNGKVNLILYVSKDLHDRFTAPQLIKDAAALVDGSGGGRADLAQAGGQNPEGLDAALARVEELVGG